MSCRFVVCDCVVWFGSLSCSLLSAMCCLANIFPWSFLSVVPCCLWWPHDGTTHVASDIVLSCANRQLHEPPDVLRSEASDGINTNLGFIISQFPVELDLFAAKHKLSTHELLAAFVGGDMESDSMKLGMPKIARRCGSWKISTWRFACGHRCDRRQSRGLWWVLCAINKCSRLVLLPAAPVTDTWRNTVEK